MFKTIMEYFSLARNLTEARWSQVLDWFGPDEKTIFVLGKGAVVRDGCVGKENIRFNLKIL